MFFEDPVERRNSLENEEASFLYCEQDPRSAFFKLNVPEWEKNIGPAVFVREDGKPLTREHVEVLIRFVMALEDRVENEARICDAKAVAIKAAEAEEDAEAEETAEAAGRLFDDYVTPRVFCLFWEADCAAKAKEDASWNIVAPELIGAEAVESEAEVDRLKSTDLWTHSRNMEAADALIAKLDAPRLQW